MLSHTFKRDSMNFLVGLVVVFIYCFPFIHGRRHFSLELHPPLNGEMMTGVPFSLAVYVSPEKPAYRPRSLVCGASSFLATIQLLREEPKSRRTSLWLKMFGRGARVDEYHALEGVPYHSSTMRLRVVEPKVDDRRISTPQGCWGEQDRLRLMLRDLVLPVWKHLGDGGRLRGRTKYGGLRERYFLRMCLKDSDNESSNNQIVGEKRHLDQCAYTTAFELEDFVYDQKRFMLDKQYPINHFTLPRYLYHSEVGKDASFSVGYFCNQLPAGARLRFRLYDIQSSRSILKWLWRWWPPLMEWSITDKHECRYEERQFQLKLDKPLKSDPNTFYRIRLAVQLYQNVGVFRQNYREVVQVRKYYLDAIVINDI